MSWTRGIESTRQNNAGKESNLIRNSKPCPLSALSLVPFENSICIDKRCHLEVIDTSHRYAKNLRAYYAMWKTISESATQSDSTPGMSSVGASPVNNENEGIHPEAESISRLGVDSGTMDCYRRFLKWIDSPEVRELPDCSLVDLNDDVVTYCADAEKERYHLHISPEGRFMHTPYSGGAAAGGMDGCERSGLEYITTGAGGWIFTVHNYELYGGVKKTTSPRLHHSSFQAGGNVQAAGLFVIDNGYLTKLYAHSGHYRPTEKNIYQLLNYLICRGVDVTNVLVDAQRIVRVSREKETGVKEKKINTTVMWPAPTMLNFLKHKCLYERLAMDAVLERAAENHPSENTRSDNSTSVVGTFHRDEADKKNCISTLLDCVSASACNTKCASIAGISNNTDKLTATVAVKTPERVRQLSGVSNASCDSLCAEFPSLSDVLCSIAAEQHASHPLSTIAPTAPTVSTVSHATTTINSHCSNSASSAARTCSSSSPPLFGRPS